MTHYGIMFRGRACSGKRMAKNRVFKCHGVGQGNMNIVICNSVILVKDVDYVVQRGSIIFKIPVAQNDRLEYGWIDKHGTKLPKM